MSVMSVMSVMTLVTFFVFRNVTNDVCEFGVVHIVKVRTSDLEVSFGTLHGAQIEAGDGGNFLHCGLLWFW